MPPDTPPADSPRDDSTLRRGAPTIRDQGPTMNLPAPTGSTRAPSALPVDQHVFTTRYVHRGVIGQGGMGEVRLAHDVRIGRDVALKIRKPGTGTSGEARARFVREAKL